MTAKGCCPAIAPGQSIKKKKKKVSGKCDPTMRVSILVQGQLFNNSFTPFLSHNLKTYNPGSSRCDSVVNESD